MVRQARKCEVDWLRRQEVYEKRPLQECRKVTGTNPIKLLWTVTNKGDNVRPNYRSRIVVREKRGKGEEGRALPAALLFSAMPPLEAVKILSARMVQERVSSRGQPLGMRFFDVSRAHFYGKAERPVYIELPEQEQDGIHCGLLKKSMYGTQDASAICQWDYTGVLESDGHVAGKANPALFYNSRDDCRSLVHGDDFCALGGVAALDQIEKALRSKCDLKVTGNLKLGTGEEQEVIFLNRVLRVAGSPGDERFEIEADPRRAEMIAKELGLGGSSAKSLDTPGLKKEEADEQERESSPLLVGEEVKRYRGVTMRAAYISPDRADLGDAVNNLAKCMQSPRQVDMVRLKRLGRYLKGRPRVVQTYRRDLRITAGEPVNILVMVDSDNAGDKISRRSTVGQVATELRYCALRYTKLGRIATLRYLEACCGLVLLEYQAAGRLAVEAAGGWVWGGWYMGDGQVLLPMAHVAAYLKAFDAALAACGGTTRLAPDSTLKSVARLVVGGAAARRGLGLIAGAVARGFIGAFGFHLRRVGGVAGGAPGFDCRCRSPAFPGWRDCSDDAGCAARGAGAAAPPAGPPLPTGADALLSPLGAGDFERPGVAPGLQARLADLVVRRRFESVEEALLERRDVAGLELLRDLRAPGTDHGWLWEFSVARALRRAVPRPSYVLTAAAFARLTALDVGIVVPRAARPCENAAAAYVNGKVGKNAPHLPALAADGVAYRPVWATWGRPREDVSAAVAPMAAAAGRRLGAPLHALPTRARAAICAAIWHRAARMVAASGPLLAREDVGALLLGAWAAHAGDADDAASDVDPPVEPPPAVLSDTCSPVASCPASPACPARLSSALDLIFFVGTTGPVGCVALAEALPGAAGKALAGPEDGDDLTSEMPGFHGYQVMQDSTAAAADAAESVAHNPTRMVLLAMYQKRGAITVCEFYKRGLVNTIFMVFGWYEPEWWLDDPDLHDCTPEQMTEMVTGGQATGEYEGWRGGGRQRHGLRSPR
ncbi:unnamed protein product, partial [Prorocentrum cordatum]